MQDKIEVNKFRNLILDMYRGFPNWRYIGMVEQVVKSQRDRKSLIKHGFLIRDNVNGRQVYGLGPNGLMLVNAWKTEKLTRYATFLAWLGVAVAVLSIIVQLTRL